MNRTYNNETFNNYIILKLVLSIKIIIWQFKKLVTNGFRVISISSKKIDHEFLFVYIIVISIL
jgi:hypothetical protein